MSSVAVIVGAIVVTGAVVAHDRTVKQNRRIGEMQAQAEREQEAKETAAREELERDQAKRDEFRRRLNPTGKSGLTDDDDNFNQPANPSEHAVRQRQNQSTGRNRLLGS